jgi:hypothetical protein
LYVAGEIRAAASWLQTGAHAEVRQRIRAALVEDRATL